VNQFAARRRHLPPLDRNVLAAFFASRLVLVITALVAENLVPRNPALTSGDTAPILRSLTSWDGWYFLGIAREGYHTAAVAGQYHDYAFLPLYPAIVGFLSLPWPALAGLIAVLVSNVAFLFALMLLMQLGTPLIGRRRASIAASWLAIWPFASAFGMAYSDGLFLALIIGAFLAAERDRRATTGILLALACLTRFQGLPLILPLWLLELRRDDWRPRPSQAWLLLGPLAVVAFLAGMAAISGSPTAYLDAQTAWGRNGIGGSAPSQTIAASISPYQVALVAALCWAVFLLVYIRRDRLPIHYSLVPVLFILAELSSGSLEAVGRVTAAAFPYVWLVANRRSIVANRVWPIVSSALFALIAMLSFGGYWVP
jgi:Gpi18-like mannosyltransferase